MKKKLLGKITFYPCFFNAGINAFFIDMADSFCRNTELDVAVFLFYEKGLRLNVRAEPALGLLVRMRNFIPFDRYFSGDFANPCHGCILKMVFEKRSAKIEVLF